MIRTHKTGFWYPLGIPFKSFDDYSRQLCMGVPSGIQDCRIRYNEIRFSLQMSGRAGRRGFDPVGNVVFFGVPYRKVQRLMTANIPKLVGNFPINVSLVLRLLLMTSTGDDKKDALTKVRKYSQPPVSDYPNCKTKVDVYAYNNKAGSH